MEQSIIILGRQPKLGIAELESLYGNAVVEPLAPPHIAATSARPSFSSSSTSTSTSATSLAAPATPQVTLVHLPPEEITFARLGGSIKLARLVATLDTTSWPHIELSLQKTALQQTQGLPEGKIKLGLSLYGYDMSVARLNAIGLNLKKALRKTGRSVRVVPNKELQLNSAQILHNSLIGQLGQEYLIIKDGNRTLIAQTVAEQDIDAYAARDQGRPKRDARVGMLPPKLAQTIVNLAVGSAKPQDETVVLDPFCGTGVVLQEASLMGFGIYGSDIEKRMVEYTDKNLMWLHESYGSPADRPNTHTDPAWRYFKLETGDATSHRWQPAPQFVACEGYLGQPFTGFPSPDKLVEVRSTCNLILKKFLQNIASQITPGTRLCVAVPAWQQKPGVFTHLPLLDSTPGAGLDHLKDLGYNRVSFKHVEQADLIYARADQIVARELLVLIKK